MCHHSVCRCLLCIRRCVCYSVSLSPGSVGLFMSLTLWVCLYLSLCVTVSVPLCVTIYPGVTTLLTAQATGGRVGPTGARAGAHPIPLAMGQAGRLFAMPAPGKHQDPEPKGHLPHLHPCPSACPGPGWTRAPQAVPAPKLELCPDPPPPLVTSLPKPQPWPRPVCLSAFLCVCVCWPPCLFLSLLPLTWVSVVSPSPRMTCVFLLSLSLYLNLSVLSR